MLRISISQLLSVRRTICSTKVRSPVSHPLSPPSNFSHSFSEQFPANVSLQNIFWVFLISASEPWAELQKPAQYALSSLSWNVRGVNTLRDSPQLAGGRRLWMNVPGTYLLDRQFWEAPGMLLRGPICNSRDLMHALVSQLALLPVLPHSVHSLNLSIGMTSVHPVPWLRLWDKGNSS